MTVLDQRILLGGIFCPHVLAPCNQILSKGRRIAAMSFIIAIFAAILFYSFRAPCDNLEATRGRPYNLTRIDYFFGYFNFFYVVLAGWGIEIYRSVAIEATWILTWRRLTDKTHSAQEVLAFVRATVLGGDQGLTFFKWLSKFMKLTWQDQFFQSVRYIGVWSIFTALLLLTLSSSVGVSSTSSPSLTCNFQSSYWIAALCLLALAFLPIIAAIIAVTFTVVPPLTPHAAAVSLHNIVGRLGHSSWVADDYTYMRQFSQCHCRWCIRYQHIGKYSYPVFETDGLPCRCSIEFLESSNTMVPNIATGRNQLYLIIAAGAAFSIIAALKVSKQLIGQYFVYATYGQLWVVAVTFVFFECVSHVLKDVSRRRFLNQWLTTPLSAGFIAMSVRVWGSGAEWACTALFYAGHRKFGWLVIWAYAINLWVIGAGAMMNVFQEAELVEILNASSSTSSSVNSAAGYFADLTGAAGIFISGIVVCFWPFKKLLSRERKDLLEMPDPQPLQIIRWVNESIDIENRQVHRATLHTPREAIRRIVNR